MKELFPKDAFPEQDSTAKKLSQKKGYGSWVAIAVLILVGFVIILCQVQIGNTIKPGIAHDNQGDYTAAESEFRKRLYRNDSKVPPAPNNGGA